MSGPADEFVGIVVPAYRQDDDLGAFRDSTIDARQFSRRRLAIYSRVYDMDVRATRTQDRLEHG